MRPVASSACATAFKIRRASLSVSTEPSSVHTRPTAERSTTDGAIAAGGGIFSTAASIDGPRRSGSARFAPALTDLKRESAASIKYRNRVGGLVGRALVELEAAAATA